MNNAFASHHSQTFCHRQPHRTVDVACSILISNYSPRAICLSFTRSCMHCESAIGEKGREPGTASEARYKKTSETYAICQEHLGIRPHFYCLLTRKCDVFRCLGYDRDAATPMLTDSLALRDSPPFRLSSVSSSLSLFLFHCLTTLMQLKAAVGWSAGWSGGTLEGRGKARSLGARH